MGDTSSSSCNRSARSPSRSRSRDSMPAISSKLCSVRSSPECYKILGRSSTTVSPSNARILGCAKRTWNVRIWPLRPYFLQFPFVDAYSNVPFAGTQIWRFPSPIQWAKWLANFSSFRLVDGSDLEGHHWREATKMIRSDRSLTRREMCDDWVENRPDLVDADEYVRNEFKQYFAFGKEKRQSIV